MANYLDLNGTTDVVGRIKAKLNEKASNDDVQLVVDELALKANKEDVKYYTHDVDTIDGGYGIVVNPPTSTKTEAVNWEGGSTLTLFEDEQYRYNLPSGTKLYFNLDKKEYLTNGDWCIRNQSNNEQIAFSIDTSYKFKLTYVNDWDYIKVYSDKVQIVEIQKDYDLDTIHFEFVDESLVYYTESLGSRPTMWCEYYTEGDRYSKGVYVDDNNTLAKIATKSEIPNAYSKSETDTQIKRAKEELNDQINFVQRDINNKYIPAIFNKQPIDVGDSNNNSFYIYNAIVPFTFLSTLSLTNMFIDKAVNRLMKDYDMVVIQFNCLTDGNKTQIIGGNLSVFVTLSGTTVTLTASGSNSLSLKINGTVYTINSSSSLSFNKSIKYLPILVLTNNDWSNTYYWVSDAFNEYRYMKKVNSTSENNLKLSWYNKFDLVLTNGYSQCIYPTVYGTHFYACGKAYKLGYVNGTPIASTTTANNIQVAPNNFGYQSSAQSNAVILNPTDIMTKYYFKPNTITNITISKPVRLENNFNVEENYKFTDSNGNYFTFTYGYEISNYVTNGLTMEDLFIYTYDSDGNQVTFGDGITTFENTFKLEKSSAFSIDNVDYPTYTSILNVIASYDTGLYEKQNGGDLVKIPTMDDIDEKIGDINNALETIIG